MMQIPLYDALDDLPPQSMTRAKEEPPTPPAGTCAWCDGPAQGNHWISRDGIGLGPLLPLCDDHGACKNPSAKMVRRKLRIAASIGAEESVSATGTVRIGGYNVVTAPRKR